MKGTNPFAAMRKIVESDGAAALYQGWWSAVVSLGASNFVYFYAYNALKNAFKRARGIRDIDAVTNLLVASVAGVINVLATTPLWVVGTRLATQRKKAKTSYTTDQASGKVDERPPYTGVWNCLTRIVNEEGPAALWKGVGPSLILVSNPSIQFVAYERMRQPMVRVAERRGSSITPFEFFVMGAIAKAVATLLTYPPVDPKRRPITQATFIVRWLTFFCNLPTGYKSRRAGCVQTRARLRRHPSVITREPWTYYGRSPPRMVQKDGSRAWKPNSGKQFSQRRSSS